MSLSLWVGVSKVYWEARHPAKTKVAKEMACCQLYVRLDTKEGEKDLYSLAGKDVQLVWMFKDTNGNVITREERLLRNTRRASRS